MSLHLVAGVALLALGVLLFGLGVSAANFDADLEAMALADASEGPVVWCLIGGTASLCAGAALFLLRRRALAESDDSSLPNGTYKHHNHQLYGATFEGRRARQRQ
ncbi:MAG: hypothetical protein ACKVX7_13620 [Planctomycetota bacterium]